MLKRIVVGIAAAVFAVSQAVEATTWTGYNNLKVLRLEHYNDGHYIVWFGDSVSGTPMSICPYWITAAGSGDWRAQWVEVMISDPGIAGPTSADGMKLLYTSLLAAKLTQAAVTAVYTAPPSDSTHLCALGDVQF